MSLLNKLIYTFQSRCLKDPRIPDIKLTAILPHTCSTLGVWYKDSIAVGFTSKVSLVFDYNDISSLTVHDRTPFYYTGLLGHDIRTAINRAASYTLSDESLRIYKYICIEVSHCCLIFFRNYTCI